MTDETLPLIPGPVTNESLKNLRRLGGYDLLEVLGEGAMGVVYRAHDRSLKREVALKVLKPYLLENPVAVERFRREASAAARLSHPNLLPIFEIGREDGRWFFAMELASGRTLYDVIEEQALRGEPSPVALDRERLATFLRHFAEVCDALHLAHERGILHRDIKPSNLLIAADGTMKLVDFGLAKDLEVAQLTMTGTMLGTPHYMSPEQISGESADLDRRSDVYSLGVTLYEALTLRKPFQTSSLPTLVGQIVLDDPPTPRALGLRFPPDLVAVLFKAIEKDRIQRYPTAAEFAADLRRFVDYEPVLARPHSAWVRLRKTLKRNRRVARAAVLTTMAMLVLVLLPTLIALGKLGYESVESSIYNRRAHELYGQAMVAPPEARARLLAALVRDWPEADIRAGAQLSLGRTHLALTEWEAAQAAWAEAYLAAPESAAGQSALLDLAREFHEVGRRHQAHDAVQDVLAGPATPGVRARALLLAGEIALTFDRPEEAAWYLDRAAVLSREAGTALAPRISQVKGVISDFLPARIVEATDARAVVVGCFRVAGRPELLLVGKDACELLFIEDDGTVSRTPVPIRLGTLNSSPVAGDLDGDGLDDLVHPSADGEWWSPEYVRSWNLAHGEPELICELPILHSDYQAVIGDFDNDGRNDLFMGMSYPVRGVFAFRNAGAEGFVPQPVGDLARLGPARSDGRDVAICDINGDGRNEVLVAAEGFSVHSPVVARFVSPERGFEEISAEVVGFVNNLEVFDSERDGQPEVYLGLETYLYHEIRDQYAAMKPQGLYRMTWNREAGAPEFSPVYRHRAIRFGTGDRMRPPPMNVSISLARCGRVAETGPFAVTWHRSYKGLRSLGSFLAVMPLGVAPVRPILIPTQPVSSRSALVVADLDRDAEDEFVLLEKDRLRIGGLGGKILPQEPRGDTAAVGGTPRRRAGILPIADRLRALEHYARAEAAYQSVIDDAPRSADAVAAWEGRISIRGRIRDYDGCLTLIGEYERLHPEQARRARYLRACTLHEAGDLGAAAEEYGALREVRGLDQAEQAHADRLAPLLRPWLSTTEIPLDGFAELPVSAPGTMHLGEDGVLHGRDSAMQECSIWWPLEWRGGSFQFEFDLKVDTLDWSRGISVGFQKVDCGSRIVEGLHLYTGHSSTMPRGGCLTMGDGKVAVSDSWSQRGGLDLPHGRWLHYRLVYDAPTDSAHLAIRDEQGRAFYFLRIDPPFRMDPSGCRLAIRVRAADRPREACFAFRNPRLFHPRTDPDAPVANHTLPRNHPASAAANNALMRGDEAEALRLYREFTSAYQPEHSRRIALAFVAAGALDYRLNGSRAGRALALRAAATLEVSLPKVMPARGLLTEAEVEAFLE